VLDLRPARRKASASTGMGRDAIAADLPVGPIAAVSELCLLPLRP